VEGDGPERVINNERLVSKRDGNARDNSEERINDPR